MRMRLPGKLWGVGAIVALLVSALALAPAGAGAQTAGSLSASLAGGSSISVTLNGVAAGNSYNIFACSALVGAPSAPTCAIASTPITAGSNGTASGTVTVALNNYAVSEVFAQNVDNSSELYSFVVNSGPATPAYTSVATTPTYTTTTSSTATTSCASGTVLTYVNGYPVCSPTSAGCTSYGVVNGMITCLSYGGTTTTCTAYSYVNGVPYCVSNGYTGAQVCTSYGYVNGNYVCTSYGYGYGYGSIPGCISYTFVNGVPVCLQY